MLKQMLHTELPFVPSFFPIQTNFVHSSNYITYPTLGLTNDIMVTVSTNLIVLT